MTQSDAFLAAIADRPDDDLPRLVYADWLDEHGQPERAEFIRVQVELAKLPTDDLRRMDLRERERALLDRHRYEWRLPQFVGTHQRFQRGFVEHVRAAGEWLLAHPTALPTASMVRSLRITNAAAAGMELADLPGLEQVVHLELTNTFTGRGFDIPEFLTAARLTRLRALSLGNCGLWGWLMPQLMEVERLRQLDQLDLWGNPFSDAGAVDLANSPNLANLNTLDLSAHEQPSVNCVSEEGAAALANSAHLTRLRDLDLSDHYIGRDGLVALVNSPNARSLERLAVAYNEIGGHGWVEAVVDSPHLGNLRELVFAGNRLSTLDAETLAAWPHLATMRFVDLRECDFGEFGDTTRERLLRSAWAERLVL